MNTSSRIKISESIFDSKLFAGLNANEMSLLVDQAKPRSYKAGSTILKEGEDGEEFYWISCGRIQIQSKVFLPKVQDITLNTIEKGDVMGEMGLLGFTKRTGTAIAVEDTDLYVWKYQETLMLFTSHPNIGYRVVRNVGHMVGLRLINMNAKLKDRIELSDANWWTE